MTAADENASRLIDRCFAALDDAELPEQVQSLLIAALMGGTALQEHLDGSFVPPPRVPAPPPAQPQRAYLRAVSVRGFRGIGAESTLKLAPGPGLTLVVGRNGSGKSSFAEAVEYLLSGTSFRWAGRPTKEWEDGWRNLHCPDTTKIAAEFVVDGTSGAVRLGAEWTDEAGLSEADLTTRSVGSGGDGGTPDLGWAVAVTTHRPLLSYPELARIADAGPSKLYDSMAAILGLDALVDVHSRLADARKTVEARVKDARAQRDALVQRLGSSDDERAPVVTTALEARKVDADLLRALVLASLHDDSGATVAAALRRAIGSELPTSEAASEAAHAFDEAENQLNANASVSIERSERHLHLLEGALEIHVDEGDGRCPVCRTGPVDHQWHVEAAEEVERLRREVGDVKELRAAHLRATETCRNLTAKALSLAPVIDEAMGIDCADLRDALTAFQSAADAQSPRQALDSWADLAAAHQLMQESARTRLDSLDDRWRPLAMEVLMWLDESEATGRARLSAADLKDAASWVSELTETIRAERFGPIEEQVISTWNGLRQSSNVQIDGLRLSGTRTRRRVDLDVSVDGSATSALAVMSQGELNALALSLFLPRATLPDSPFGFMVIDDPVQAMDPSRVDGLATVLALAAVSHQVVVFTHDDRLPDAVRRLGLPARLIGVERGEHSSVKTAPLLDPVSRYLEDARAIVRSDGVEVDLVERVVAGLCRQAVEAAAVDVYRRSALSRGVRHDVVETNVNDAVKFTEKCALAIYDDRSEAGKVLSYFNNKSSRLGDAAADCARGAHSGPLKIEPRHLPSRVEELCAVLGYARE